jgi:hypothetical protein
MNNNRFSDNDNQAGKIQENDGNVVLLPKHVKQSEATHLLTVIRFVFLQTNIH